jgi:hypothetical protein
VLNSDFGVTLCGRCGPTFVQTEGSLNQFDSPPKRAYTEVHHCPANVERRAATTTRWCTSVSYLCGETGKHNGLV